MPFCPECAFEYSDDVMVCPECRVKLVKRLPTVGERAAMALDDSWVAVCHIGDELSTEMIRGLLDSNNIPSMVTTSIFQSPGNGAGWAAKGRPKNTDKRIVMVPREFKDEAELLLSAVLGDDFELMDMREH